MKPFLDPTMMGDWKAERLRDWYEHNREGFWDRYRQAWRWSSDDFMLGLLAEARRIEDEAAAIDAAARRNARLETEKKP